jgi:hypothetical protein
MRVVCWLWRGREFWKDAARYDGEHVAVLASMLRRNGGHSLTCIHDGGFVLPAGVDAIRMPADVAALPDYLPKLWAWSPMLQGLIAERFASIDLDVVLLGDVAQLVAGPEPVRLWNGAKYEPYNTSLFAVEPGFGHEVWESYTPDRLAAARARAEYWTGDQSWVAHVLGLGMPTFSEADGVVRYRRSLHRSGPPAGALAAFLCGPYEPRSEGGCAEWIRQAWR